MDILNHLAQAAAVLILIEVMVLAIIFLAIAGGLSYGLRWVNARTAGWYQQANHYTGLGARYVHIGTDYAAKPITVTARYAQTVKGIAAAVRTEARRLHDLRTAQLPVAARPVEPPAEEQQPIEPLV